MSHWSWQIALIYFAVGSGLTLWGCWGIARWWEHRRSFLQAPDEACRRNGVESVP